MNILYQCNDRYAPYCGVSVTSLFENNSDADAICVYILDDSISEDNKKKFAKLAEKYGRKITFVPTKSLVEKMKALGIPKYRNSYTTNMKMFAGEVIDGVDRLLYVDSDTVVDGSLKGLFSIDLSGHPIAMAMDSLVHNYKTLIGLHEKDKYYNAGVILFNMPEWKSRKCCERIVEHIKNVRAHYSAPDQDLINIVLGKEIFELPPKFNFQPVHIAFSDKLYLSCFKSENYYDEQTIEQCRNDIRIAHFFRFLGEFPWDRNNKHPYNELFNKYLQKSPWADYQKKDSGVSFVFKVEKILYSILPKSVFIRLFKASHEFFMKKSNRMSLENKNNKLM